MTRFYAATLINATLALERARGVLITKGVYGGDIDAIALLHEALDRLDGAMEQLRLSSTVRHSIQSIRKDAQNGADHQYLAALLGNLETSIQVELSEWLFLAVQPDKRGFYAAPEKWFGYEILEAYPDSATDLKAAARCLALDEWTACVFHLMRGVEAALRRWSDQLGLVLRMPVVDANWHDILGEADRALKQLEQERKSPQRSEDLEYFGETAAQFRAIKNAWRNQVAHSKGKYDERDAVEIMQHVAAFMRKLASRS